MHAMRESMRHYERSISRNEVKERAYDISRRNCGRQCHYSSFRIGLIHLVILVLFASVAAQDSPTAPEAAPNPGETTVSSPVSIPLSSAPIVAPTDEITPKTSPPTIAIILSPTSSPSDSPDESPIAEPTSWPTDQASSPPIADVETNNPSGEPSGLTIAPTFFISDDPSIAPSLSPSATASSIPTLTYSSPPSSKRSSIPSSVPTPLPSFTPSTTVAPSKVPSTLPSLSPTAAPSMTPSLSPQEYLVEVVMFFDDAQELGRTSKITFHRETGDHIFDEFVSYEGLQNPLYELKVGVNIKTQSSVANFNTRGRRMLRDARRLQASPLKIVFDTVVSFQSLSRDLDVSAMIGGAFYTDEDRAKYLNSLQSTGDRAFSSINNLRVEINGIPQEEPDKPKGSGGANIWIIIGASAGGAVLLIVAGLLLFCLYVRRDTYRKETTVATASKTSGDERVDTDILVENQDDVSTLGDPMYVPGGMLLPGLERDDTVTASIVSGDYDYARNYGVAESSPAHPRGRADTLQSSLDGSQLNGSITDMSSYGLGKMDNSFFSDDLSFEQQFVNMEERFEVIAPKGKLGMVIDTPSGGVPVVHAIKDTSVLADKVEVGDRLLSVDDQDTTGLTAMQVSKLISRKAENPSRILVFARTLTRGMSDDLNERRR